MDFTELFMQFWLFDDIEALSRFWIGAITAGEVDILVILLNICTGKAIFTYSQHLGMIT
jgi:hypothetical protein